MNLKVYNLIFLGLYSIALSMLFFAQSSVVDLIKYQNRALNTVMYSLNDSCAGHNPEFHDGSVHRNAYSKISDSLRWAIKFKPQEYPWLYNNVCVGFTCTVPGSSLTYRVVMYDSGAGGPAGLKYVSDPQTMLDLPVFPAYRWYSVSINPPVIDSGAVYIGVEYCNLPASNVCIAADENSPIVWPGYISTLTEYPNSFMPIQLDSEFPNYRSLAIRTDGRLFAAGNKVTTTLKEPPWKDKFSVALDTSHLRGGFNFNKFKAGDFSKTKKMVPVK